MERRSNRFYQSGAIFHEDFHPAKGMLSRRGYTVNGAPKLIKTPYGFGREFNGTTDALVTKIGSFATTFTFHFIFKLYVSGPTNPFLGRTDGSGSGPKIGFLISPNNLFFRAVDSGGFVSGNIGYVSSLNNFYNKLTVYRDASNSVKSVLNNGNEITLGTLSGTFEPDMLMANRSDLTQAFKGVLSLFVAFPSALTATEIALLHA